MEASRLSIEALGKSFTAPVLTDISLTLGRGEILGLVGENGAGKTTLVNILTGSLQRDRGEILLDGTPYVPSSPRDGIDEGVSCVAQELSIIDSLSVAENISLKKLPATKAIIRRDELRTRARQILDRVGLPHIEPKRKADRLSLADKQLLELAKALATRCRLLLLDEPTSALTSQQADRLHKIVRELASQGTSIIYISHRLDDVLDIADSISVLRDGRCVAHGASSSFSVADIVAEMTGEKHKEKDATNSRVTEGNPVLEVDQVTTAALPHPISIDCAAGEIIGIAGLAGAGRSELLEALFGLTPLTSGEVRRVTGHEKALIGSASQAVHHGLGFLGEDRQSMGLFPGQPVLANITLPGISRVASFFGLIDRKKEEAVGIDLVHRLGIRCASLNQDIDQLSGGNQQKALIARWVHCDSDIFLLDEPTRGVDVGTKNAIYALLFEMQSAGKTVILASSEIDELMTVCDRIIVLSDRQLVQVFERGAWSETEILTAAFSNFMPGSVTPTGSARSNERFAQ